MNCIARVQRRIEVMVAHCGLDLVGLVRKISQDRAGTAEAPVALGAVAEPFCESGACGIEPGMALQPLN